jgi:hypothetical protein
LRSDRVRVFLASKDWIEPSQRKKGKSDCYRWGHSPKVIPIWRALARIKASRTRIFLNGSDPLVVLVRTRSIFSPLCWVFPVFCSSVWAGLADFS